MVYLYNGILFCTEKALIPATSMTLENIMLSEGSQMQKTTHCMTPFILNVQKRQIYRDKRLVVAGLVQGPTSNRNEGSCWGKENVLKSTRMMVAKLCKFIKQHWTQKELCAANRWILSQINCTSIIKLLEK